MSLKYIFALLLLSVFPAAAQSPQDVERQAREQAIRDNQARRREQIGLNRLRIISERHQSAHLVRRKHAVLIKYKPSLTAADIRAIEIHEDDLRQFNYFLRQPKTGIVRLHNADVCLPNKNIIQAESNCPNNVSGKATGFSFRRDDYNFDSFSDIFFSKNSFSAPGMFTVGIFSRLGETIEIGTLTAASDGVRQLVEFTAPETQDEAERLLFLMKTGAEVGGRVYKSSAEVKINETYVLRSIAYRGKALRQVENGFKVNVLDTDERSDVLIVFRPVRKHDDGSVTLIWKELARKSVPKIVLKEIEGNSK
jgi:hypothetical protein